MSGESTGSISSFRVVDGRGVIFLFFREDVLTASCLGSSGSHDGIKSPGSPTAHAQGVPEMAVCFCCACACCLYRVDVMCPWSWSQSWSWSWSWWGLGERAMLSETRRRQRDTRGTVPYRRAEKTGGRRKKDLKCMSAEGYRCCKLDFVQYVCRWFRFPG
jgi:hypothetical protein